MKDAPVVAVHFWANWNLSDREFDKTIRRFETEYKGQITFRSMDTDKAENWPVLQSAKILNLPAIGIWTKGGLAEVVTGCRNVNAHKAALDRAVQAGGR